MESKTVTVCILVVVLGIAAAAAGFAAEATRVKNPTIRVSYYGMEPQVECTYPSSPAMGLAIAATVALVVARVIITSATDGCCSCCKSIPHLSRFARFCIVISWITSSTAVILFVAGAKLSSQRSAMRNVDGDYGCYIVRPGIFSSAAVMSILSVLLALVYYLNYVSARNGIAETQEVELEIEAPPITDAKKPPITDAKKPSQKN